MHKIKAVSSLSGVPTPTLRVWESRYAAFSPQRSTGGQRLYSDEDVLRATLLKRLTEQGQAISALAGQSVQSLQAQWLACQNLGLGVTPPSGEPRALTVCVVDWVLASRLKAPQFVWPQDGVHIQVTAEFENLQQALLTPNPPPAQLLLIRTRSLHIDTYTEIARLAQDTQAMRVLVLYNFGQSQVLELMKKAGIRVRREPVSDSDLAELVQAELLVDARRGFEGVQTGVLIPKRKYSDAALLKISQVSTDVLCECPRHVADIIGLLCHFEQYSQECLNKNAEDAHLHAQLNAVAGSARALFEQAMEALAQHENIDLVSLTQATESAPQNR
jgi:MerR family transcriptional regulator, light-induced transcriptional regulator